MADIRRLHSTHDLEALLAESERRPVLLLKHSTQCPVSAWAHREFQKYVAGLSPAEATAAMVRVIEERPVSQEAAARLGVTHQSPQVILIRGGRAVWHASHYEASETAIQAARAELDGGAPSGQGS